MRNNIGFSGTARGEDNFPDLTGRDVRVNCPNVTYVGIYQGVRDGMLLLNPSYVSGGLPIEEKNGDYQYERNPIHEKESHSYINMGNIAGIQPMPEGYTRNLVERIKDIKDKQGS